MKKDKYWVGICISIFLTLEKKVITTIFFLSFSSPTFPASFELNNFKWESWQIEFDLHNFVQHIQSNLFNLNIVLSPSQHYNMYSSLASLALRGWLHKVIYKLFLRFPFKIKEVWSTLHRCTKHLSLCSNECGEKFYKMLPLSKNVEYVTREERPERLFLFR